MADYPTPKKNTVKSAKDILWGHDFLSQREKVERYIHHEFQDYGYYLATALGDLEHRSIYMRIAKTTPRHVIERALSFANDYKEPNRGKLFMWKLKQIREEVELHKANQNFTYEFVMTRMGKLYDELAKSLFQKFARSGDNEELMQTIAEVVKLSKELPVRKNRKALILDSRGGYISDMFASIGFKTETLEISRELAKLTKQKFSKLKVTRCIFDNDRFKDGEFDLIWVGDMWKWIPLAAEQSNMGCFAKISRPSGLLCMSFNEAAEAKEEWTAFNVGEDPKYRFLKNEPLQRVIELAESYKLQFTSAGNYLVLQKATADMKSETT